jgi:nucleoside 2-deoxyribosyltransferase
MNFLTRIKAPKRIVVCGSTRYLEQLIAWTNENVKGNVRITYPESRAKTIEEKERLIADYLIKIDEADEVIVFNGDIDYIGDNTHIEIGFALAHHKPVFISHISERDEIRALKLKVWKEACNDSPQ